MLKKLKTVSILGILCTAVIAVLGMAGCSSDNLKGTIKEDGSTTVYPVAVKLSSGFSALHPNVIVNTAQGGSGVGITDADAGTVDIGASSRALTSADPALHTYLIGHD